MPKSWVGRTMVNGEKKEDGLIDKSFHGKNLSMNYVLNGFPICFAFARQITNGEVF